MNAEKNTLLTWYPPEYVAQHQKNRALVAGTPYEKYLADTLEVPVAMVEALKWAPLPEKALFAPTREDLNRLFQQPYNLPVAGYGLLGNAESGRIICSFSRHFFPGATAQMLEWWFAWHMGHDERYALWSPYAHVQNRVPYPERLEDLAKTYAEKLYDPENPNQVVELTGDQLLNVTIHFRDPFALGLTQETWQQGGYGFSASGWSDLPQSPGVPSGMMFHLGREVPGGLELISHYWLGTHRGMTKLTGLAQQVEAALKQAPAVPEEALLQGAFAMSMHDMIEFTRLSQILPALYAEFGK